TSEERDPTSCLMMEQILAQEEEHADELVNLLFAVEPHTGGSPQRLYVGDEVPRRSDAGTEDEGETRRGGAGRRSIGTPPLARSSHCRGYCQCPGSQAQF